MANDRPIYIPGREGQQALMAALGVKNVYYLEVRAGERGDDRVDLLLHPPPGGTCLSQFSVEQKPGTVVIEKSFCGDDTKTIETVDPKTKERYFTLKSLFIPDADIEIGLSPFWEAIRTPLTTPGGVGSRILWKVASPALDPFRFLWPSVLYEKEDFSKELEGSGFQFIPEMILAVGTLEERRLLGGVTALINPMATRLEQDIVERWVMHPPVEQVALTFWESTQKITRMEDLDPFMERSFGADLRHEIREQVRTVVFFHYPFVSPETLDALVQVTTGWVLRRILYVKINRQIIEVRPDPIPQRTSPTLVVELKRVLRMALFRREIHSDRVLDLVRAYQAWSWQRSGMVQGPFQDPQRVARFMAVAREEFDQEIGKPALREVVSELKRDPSSEKKAAHPRLRALLGIQENREITLADVGQAASIPWEVMNFYLRPEEAKEFFDETRLEERNATDFKAFQEVPGFLTGGLTKPYRLTTVGALALADRLRTLHKGEGEREALHRETAVAIASQLLAAGEGDYLEIDLEGRHALRMLQERPFDETRLWPYVVGGVGAVGLGLGIACLFLCGGDEKKALTVGVGNNGGGTGPGTSEDPKPSGRGSKVETGP